MRAKAAMLRGMSSKEAADWLKQHDEPRGSAIKLLEHVSLRKRDYRRLAVHFLSGRTHAHAGAYRLFALRLGLKELVRTLAETPRSEGDAALLAYHLRPMLEDAKDDEERQEATAYVNRLSPP